MYSVKVTKAMENEEKVMSGEESLRVISEMINKTRVSITQSSFHLLFWGWLIFACSLSEFLLWKLTDWTNVWYVWLIVIPGVFVSMIYGFVRGKREKVFTYGTAIYVWTWMAFLVSSVIFFIIFPVETDSVGRYMLLLAAMPLFISGVVLRFRPLMWGAGAFWVLALVAHFGGATVSGLAMPGAMVVGYLIPGYLLRKRGSHDTIQGA
jgi:cation transport ATPase